MSELKVDTLTGKTTAGNVTVTSENGAATFQMQQGLAKAWMRYTTSTTTVTRDSFNVSTESDNGPGDTTFTFTNNMQNTYYSISAIANLNTSSAVPNRMGIGTNSTGETDYTTTSTVRIISHTGNGTTSGNPIDNLTAGALVLGDLA